MSSLPLFRHGGITSGVLFIHTSIVQLNCEVYKRIRVSSSPMLPEIQFLLLFYYSYPHPSFLFSLPCPSHPLFPPSIPALLSMSTGHLQLSLLFNFLKEKISLTTIQDIWIQDLAGQGVDVGSWANHVVSFKPCFLIGDVGVWSAEEVHITESPKI